MKHISQRFIGLVVAASVLAEAVAPVSATYAIDLPGAPVRAPITAPHPATTIRTSGTTTPIKVGLAADQQAQQAIDQFAASNYVARQQSGHPGDWAERRVLPDF